jgi:two-component system sensor kinase FixL
MLTRTQVIKAISSASLDAVVAIDLDGVIVDWNAEAEKAFGWTEGEACGRFLHDLIIPHVDREPHIRGLKRYAETGQADIFGQRFERTALRNDGTSIEVELSVMKVPSSNGDAHICFLRDLTSEREAQTELKRLQSKLVHVARLNAMGTMAATLAHELNQPLAAASNYLSGVARIIETRQDRSLDEAKFALQCCRDAIARAGDTIRSVRVMLDKRPLDLATESLRHLIQETLRLLSADMREQITTSIEADADDVTVNRVQIEQVLLNLIRNARDALHSTSDPKIRISARRIADTIEVCVSDNGPGLPQDYDDPFTAFNTTKEDGLGMGLSICRTIIEAHGGKIWFGGGETGARICFTLPAAIDEG